MQYRKNEDVVRVFDAKWRANNNRDIEKIRKRDEIRRKKILSASTDEYLSEDDFTCLNDEPRVQSSMEIQLDRLKRNMDSLKRNRGKF